MLDTDTKRRIDTARDLLVGKVPDPKSQVEQITIALIYKFMDDMDAEAEELGGKRKFFSGEYGKFGWAKLMQPGIGGHELLALYADGIAKMPENPGIPALFRDIFKNAYLPYRDPETLKSFLKVINDFSYDHSERLGDAFEYLLSVLGSQGDAGQFRTPRHIIDFIVEILAPRKEESLLDPACGTAGFLISAYKHILRTNTDAKGHSTLTPQQRGEMARNFKGYDISPDMVRLSLVNLYLHGFTDPHIFEYDTLTDVARWNEYADVILANPPFMSPKGGIRPHNRFSIQAKRSEVLFVDYIAEHLTPNGRAGIIVPEGIIFQSQNAYKDLRKMLVENSLVAVISLPAGCFNPYSGVKTSILLLDKSLARQSDTIAFFKVENDGYDLGAQRRPIQKNDLPKVQEELESYLATLRERKEPSELSLTTALIVPKEKIAANGDYNLSGERYREGVVNTSSWPLAKVGDAFRKGDRSVLPESLDGPVTYIGLENITQNTGSLEGEVITTNPSEIKSLKNVFEPGNILYGKLRPNLNKVWIAGRQGICSTDIFVIEADKQKAVPDLFAYVFRSKRFNDSVMAQLKGAQLPRVGWSSFSELEIPLPPLEIQKEIVAEIEAYQKIINGARAILDNYRPHILINPDWPASELGSLCSIKTGKKDVNSGNPDGQYPFFTCAREHTYSDVYSFDCEAILVAGNGDVGAVQYYEGKFEAYQRTYVLSDFKGIGGRLLYFALNGPLKETVSKQKQGNTMPYIKLGMLSEFPVPVPPLAEQQAIVAEIEAEQALVNANRELITRFEAKIQTTLSRIWGEEAKDS
jgi:type I restriction enzyme M protein